MKNKLFIALSLAIFQFSPLCAVKTDTAVFTADKNYHMTLVSNANPYHHIHNDDINVGDSFWFRPASMNLAPGVYSCQLTPREGEQDLIYRFFIVHDDLPNGFVCVTNLQDVLNGRFEDVIIHYFGAEENKLPLVNVSDDVIDRLNGHKSPQFVGSKKDFHAAHWHSTAQQVVGLEMCNARQTINLYNRQEPHNFIVGIDVKMKILGGNQVDWEVFKKDHPTLAFDPNGIIDTSEIQYATASSHDELDGLKTSMDGILEHIREPKYTLAETHEQIRRLAIHWGNTRKKVFTNKEIKPNDKGNRKDNENECVAALYALGSKVREEGRQDYFMDLGVLNLKFDFAAEHRSYCKKLGKLHIMLLKMRQYIMSIKFSFVCGS